MPILVVIDGTTYSIPLPHDKNWGSSATATIQAEATALAARLKLSGGTMTGHITLFADPTDPLHPATRNYVDTAMLGIRAKPECRLATTANVNLASALANGQTLDGATIATGDRILVKNQTLPAENGIWLAPSSGAASRATDMDVFSEAFQAFVSITAGSTNANTGWLSNSANTGTIGVTAIGFVRFSGSGSLGTAAALNSGSADGELPTGSILKGTVRGFTKQQYFARATLTDGASIAWDLDNAQKAKVTLAGNRALANPTNMKDGGEYSLRVIQDATGSRTLSYGSAFKWTNGVTPTFGIAPGSWMVLTFDCDGTYMTGAAAGPFGP